MKRLNLSYCLLFGLTTLVACKDVEKSDKNLSDKALSEGNFKEITVTDEFRISIPEIMVPTTGLNNEALVQFQNIDYQIYLIVLEESKKELERLLASQREEVQDLSILSKYRELQMNRLGEAMKIEKRIGPKKLTIHELNAELLEIVGRLPSLEEDLYYSLTFIEGNGEVYTMMCWTLDSKKDSFRTTFEQIAKSFQSIAQSPTPTVR